MSWVSRCQGWKFLGKFLGHGRTLGAWEDMGTEGVMVIGCHECHVGHVCHGSLRCHECHVRKFHGKFFGLEGLDRVVRI